MAEGMTYLSSFEPPSSTTLFVDRNYETGDWTGRTQDDEWSFEGASLPTLIECAHDWATQYGVLMWVEFAAPIGKDIW